MTQELMHKRFQTPIMHTLKTMPIFSKEKKDKLRKKYNLGLPTKSSTNFQSSYTAPKKERSALQKFVDNKFVQGAAPMGKSLGDALYGMFGGKKKIDFAQYVLVFVFL